MSIDWSRMDWSTGKVRPATHEDLKLVDEVMTRLFEDIALRPRKLPVPAKSSARWRRRSTRHRSVLTTPTRPRARPAADGQVTIYALYADGEVFYVGKTAGSAESRLRGHLSACRRLALPSHRRINELLSRGVIPEARVVQVVPEVCWEEAERFWISEFRRRGCPLVNIDDGGQFRGRAHPKPESTCKCLKSLRDMTNCY